MFNKEDKTMRELIKSVAEVISDLQTLNLLKKKNVTTTINIDEQTKKYILTVEVIASEEVVHLSLEMFQKFRDYGYVINVKENNRKNPVYSILAVNFYEQ